MLNIVEQLDRERFAPAVCVLKKGGALDHVVESLGIPFIEAPFHLAAKPYYSLIPRALRAAQIFRPYQFKIWHSFHYSDDYTEGLIARASGSQAWIITKKNMSWGSRAWQLRALLATRIAAQNTDMMAQFFDRFPLKQKSFLRPPGVDLIRFKPGSGASTQFRDRLSVPAGNVLLTLVAHMVPIKGHPIVIEAMNRVQRGDLLLAGKGLDHDYFSTLQKMAAESEAGNRIHFLGDIVDVPSLLGETDIFLFASGSTGEGCPVALIEAMSSGLACIATDIPGSRDLIQHEHNGLLVPPGDAGAMAAAINLLIGDKELRQRLGAAARERVEQHLSVQHEVAAYQKVYCEILGFDEK